ncbi:hypothetical protein LTR85_010796 [Meristemomyces frigidus]|nr:hypothetical protein LTR85_010796 [Meristemomyces frigidus]
MVEEIKTHEATVRAASPPEREEPSKSWLNDKDTHLVDDAANFLASTTTYPPMSAAQEKKLIRKIDRWMIPLLMFTATLGAVDKVQISTASLYGFQTDNNMHGQDYSWVGSILSIGMLVGLYPASYLVQRLPTAKFFCACSICWSVLTLMYAACHSWAAVMVLRFLMGMFEAVISTSIMLIISAFYKKKEQPARNAIILSCFSSVINGFWSWVVGQIPDSAPLAKWQYLYLLTGSINVCYSLFILFYLPDSPINARFLNEEEKFHAVQRVAENRTGMVSNAWKWYQVREALLDPKLYLIFLFNIAVNVPNGGLITFGSLIIKSMGYSSQTSALLTMPTGVMSTLAGWIFSELAARWHNRRAVAICLSALVPLMGTALVYGTQRSNLGAQLAGLYMMYAYWGPYVTTVSLPQANTAGQTKKSVTYCALYLGYAAGNLIGPQTFRSDQAPEYTGGVIAMIVCYCLCILLVLIYWAFCAFENRRRDKLYGKPGHINEDSVQELAESFEDQTDMEQKAFRYTT